MVSYPAMNNVDLIIDEIALEGLDGITLEALWQRLARRFHDPLPLPKAFMEQVWSISLAVKGLQFFELQSPRKKLEIFDRYEFIDPDLGTILEPDEVPDDIYTHCPIDDIQNGIKGSCSTYYTRNNISEYVKNMTVHEVEEKYGQTFVIVASQALRDHALMGDCVCPTLDLTIMQYCFLERVGRSRYHGEVTQGKISLSSLGEDPKSLFYHRKFLLEHKLITKQLHHQKSSGHSCSGSLLHLPRFYVERKPKVIYLAEQVIEILKSKENCVAEYDEIKKELQIENSIKKLFKTAFFQKVVKTDLRVPYRTLYPNAEAKEWQQKNNMTKEKSIRVVQLLDPDVDVSELLSKDEINDDDEPFELDMSEQKFNVPLLKQANRMVEASGCKGVSQGDLAQRMGQTKLQARTILRNLVKTNIVATYMNDMGRQRVTKYVSKKFEKSSQMSKQFETEMHRIMELTKKEPEEEPQKMKVEESEELPRTTLMAKKAKVDNDPSVEVPSDETVELVNEIEPVILEEANTKPCNENIVSARELANRNLVFTAVKKILCKYNLTKYRHNYVRTFSNISETFASDSNNCAPVPDQNVNATPEMEETDHQLISSESLNDFNRSTEQILEEQSKVISTMKTVDRAKAITFYDSIETKLVEQQPQRSKKSSNEVIGFIEDLHTNGKKHISTITYRLLKRANMIIESVKEHKVIDDITKLRKMINEEEDREGYDVKIDKKSLIRLLQKLAKDNLVKNIKLTLRANKKEKGLMFICDPTIGINHTVIQSAVEQAKIKFCLLGSQKMKSIQDIHDKGLGTISSKKAKSTAANLKYDFKAGKRYGYSPKFVRMQKLHTFLYYLIYDHPGVPTASKTDQIAKLRSNGCTIDHDLEEEMSMVYNLEIGWKMFVPPLPKHSGWPTGWTLMCDVLLRIPLSIFLMINNVPYIIPSLDTYLNHPIKKHFLVKNLPSNIRNALLFARKYIFSTHESVTRLCYIGLIQFGPQKLKEKDQVFIYFNRRTELMDTTSSAAGYHKIENKEYPRTSYYFDSLQTVEKYWYDMWNICINTYLGGRLVVEGKDILLEDLGKKSEMIQAVKARTPEEAVLMENGFVPGDHKGAAGLDSAFFAHLKRNWNWGTSYYSQQQYSKSEEKKKDEQQRSAYLSKIKAKPLKFTEFAGLKKVTGPATVNATELRKKLHQRHKNAESRKVKQQKYQTLVSHHKSKQKSFIRRVMPRKRKVRPRVKYDEVDFCALQQMDKLRVDWEPHEDNILLMCKVAMMYLCPNPRKQMITFIAVRDVLRTYSANSYNKTSRACQRRLLYMFRKAQTAKSVALGVEELKQNFYINKRFGGIVEKMKKQCKDPYEYEEQVAKVFKELVTYIARKYYNITDVEPREPVLIPKTVQEFNLLYKLKHPMKQSSLHGFTKDVKTVADIHAATVNSIIHSSMCCGKDRTSWTYQLFRVYQQYPESLLRAAMTKIRWDQMVSMKKSYMCAVKKYGNCMPMSSSQYQLSTGYIYKFQTKWPYEVFNESYHFLHRLMQWQSENQRAELNYSAPSTVDGIEAQPVTGGLVAGIHDYVARGQIDFDIEVPDQVIMLDPRLKEKDETYQRIAQRYQDILLSLDQLNLRRKSSLGVNLIDPEVEEEDEIERREFEDKVVREKRDKEDRDRWNYWMTRNDEVGRRLEESEMKEQRDAEDRERQEKRRKFDGEMALKKRKYLQVLELGEENVPEAIVSEFRNPDDEKCNTADLDGSDSEQEENDDADDDEDNHTIRFQDGTTIKLSKEDIDGSSSDLDDEESTTDTQRTIDSDSSNNFDAEKSSFNADRDTYNPQAVETDDGTSSDASVKISPAGSEHTVSFLAPSSPPHASVSESSSFKTTPKSSKKQPKRLLGQLQNSILRAKLTDDKDQHMSDSPGSDLNVPMGRDPLTSPVSPMDGKIARLGFYEDSEQSEFDISDEQTENCKEFSTESPRDSQQTHLESYDFSNKRKICFTDPEESFEQLQAKRVRTDDASGLHMQEPEETHNQTSTGEATKTNSFTEVSPSSDDTSHNDDPKENDEDSSKRSDETKFDRNSKNHSDDQTLEKPTLDELEDVKMRTTKKFRNSSDFQNTKSTRVNEIMKNVTFGLETENALGKSDDLNDMQKRCTRIALLMMREELNDLALTESHHAHEYFVVNTFKIICSLQLPTCEYPRELIDFKGFKVPSEILPLKSSLAEELLDDIKKFATLPKNDISYEDFKEKVFGQPGVAWNDMDLVYKFVQDQKEIGATPKQLVSKFDTISEDHLYHILSLLTKQRLFLRSGVTTVHYIHHRYTDPWLIHSYKILRLDKEAQPTMPSGTMYFMEGNDEEKVEKDKHTTEGANSNADSSQGLPNETDEKQSNQNSSEKVIPEFNSEKAVRELGIGTDTVTERLSSERAAEKKTDSIPHSLKENENKTCKDEGISCEREEQNPRPGRRMQRKRTSLLQQKDIQMAAKQLDLHTAEEIKVIIKPWIRIDGVPNRRVLDRMLGAVLAYCITHPGATLARVQRRFMPALQPFHTRELVEMLEKIECLGMKTFKKPKVTLFSKPARLTLGVTTGLESDEELILEPRIDATVKFSMFLSNKLYSTDFLS